MPASASSVSIERIQAGNLTRDPDLSSEELISLLDLAADVKRSREEYSDALRGRYISLLFEKPSLRTRLTFELAIKQLGGDAVVSTGVIGDREPLKDIARNLDRWTQAIVARTFTQETIEQLAHWAAVPVVNALSDLYHPCQALADMLTIREHLREFRGTRLAFSGDGNNVAHSLMLCSARLGIHFSIATPTGYEPKAEIVAEARRFAESTGSTITLTTDPAQAVAGADAVYTDVWASMGQESETAERKRIFAPYQVNAELMSKAGRGALFMHCLPAHRGDEVTDEVIESAGSVVFDQAENRLHAQKALLLMLIQ